MHNGLTVRCSNAFENHNPLCRIEMEQLADSFGFGSLAPMSLGCSSLATHGLDQVGCAEILVEARARPAWRADKGANAMSTLDKSIFVKRTQRLA
jgi:hypothetical protein